MTRRTEQLNRIEAALLDRVETSLARLEESLAGHAAHLREQAAATRIEVRDARESAESAHAGVQALADMLNVSQAIPPAAPQPPPAVRPSAGGGTGGDTVPPARRAPGAKGM